jgi:hypothetical protein
MGPNNIVVSMIRSGNHIFIRTAAYRQQVNEHYVGPTVLMNVQFNPGTIAADGASLAQASVTILPAGRAVTWSIQGPALGAVINPNTGVITAGTTAGTILVRATDAADPTHHVQRRFRLR